MSDDMLGDMPDTQHDVPDTSQQSIDTTHGAYATSMEFVHSPFGPGGKIYEGGNPVASITPNLASPGSYHMQTFGSSQDADRHHEDQFIGDPQDQTAFWDHQDLSNDCAVVAQMSIINQYSDHPITETQAVYDSMANGWMTTGGTVPADVGKLLDLYGIPNHRVDGGTVQDLVQELQAGHRIIVGVNSGELWDTGPMGEFQNWLMGQLGLDRSVFNPADHAVSVTGIDVSDPTHPMVVLNDSGTPNGAGIEYPLDKFVDAWSSSNCFYVATDSPPPGGGHLDFDISKHFGLSAPAAFDSGQSADVFTGNLINDFNWDDLLKAI